MRLSFVILNYKTTGLLKQCLHGIEDCHFKFSHEIIVVDNHSHDHSQEMVQRHFPQVKYIASPKNVGFAAGNNIGIRASSGDYVMLVNADVAVFGDSVLTMLAYLDQHDHVGLVVPKLINPDGTTQMSCYRFPTFLVPIWRRTILRMLPNGRHILTRYMMTDWDHGDNRAIGWALGACFLIRRPALEQVGLLDERYFLYVEDVDYCRRMWARGWEIHYLASAEMVHYHQRMSANGSSWWSVFSYPARIHIRSWLKYFIKYYGAPRPPHTM